MPITLTAASLLGLLLLYLSMNVSKQRLKTKTDIGDGGHPDLIYAIRAQGNFVEYVPLSLIIIGLMEYSGVTQVVTMPLAVALVVGRLMHGLMLGKMEGRNPYRFYGTILTFLVLLLGSIAGLLTAFHIL